MVTYSFRCRVAVQCLVTVEADNETAAWALVLDADTPLQRTEFEPMRKPIYTRDPENDRYDL